VLLELAAHAEPGLDRTETVRAALGAALGATLRHVVPIGPGELPVTVTGKVRKRALRERRGMAEAAR
jgi:acyl-CoA synthetase (AMP-forming)/AMP-acid ligase II